MLLTRKKLLQAGNTRYAFGVAVTPQPMPTAGPLAGLMDLPTELLQLIMEELEESELITFAMLSKRLHYLALPTYFALHGISDPTMTITLNSYSLSVLLALRISLFVTSIRSIHCEFDGTTLLQGIRELEHLVSKLSHVEMVHIDLAHVPPDFLYFQKKNYVKTLCQSLQYLLIALVEKFCKSLTVGHGMENFPGEIKIISASVSPQGRASFAKFLGAFGRRSRRSSLVYDGRLVRKVVGAGLNIFHVHSSILFHSPFYNWTVKTLNTAPITYLCLKLTLSLDIWAAFLPCITLPSLSRLAIQTTMIPLYALSNFISRHHFITTLDLDGSLVFVQPMPSPNISLPQLHTLTATPQCIFYLLKPTNIFSSLRFISILPPMSFALRDEFDGFQTLERALSLIAQRTKNTCLSLQLPGDSGFTASWLKNSTSISDPESLRFPDCISIRLSSSNSSPFSDAVVTCLPSWLSRFPDLRHVTFGGNCLSEGTEVNLEMIRAIGEACPEMRSIRMRSQTHAISMWLAQ